VTTPARSLPCRPAFQAYIAQDAYFLRVFLRGYEAAIQRCGAGGRGGHGAGAGAGTALLPVLRDLAEGVRAELEMHVSYARAWGVDLARCTPAPATERYTAFLLDLVAAPSEVRTPRAQRSYTPTPAALGAAPRGDLTR
jgi:thiaminase/transcriptional activator TenA